MSRGWRARVTECADRLYDPARGRIDWEAAAAELGLPLIGCLHLFDALQSATAVRRLSAAADWSPAGSRAMMGFVSANLESLAGGVWRLAGVYMNVAEADCAAAGRRSSHATMAPEVRELIQKYRDDGVSWEDIHGMFPVYASPHRMVLSFSGAAKRRPPGSAAGSTPAAAAAAAARWSCAETARARELLELHYRPGDLLPVVDAAMREFPAKTYAAIRKKIGSIMRNERLPGAPAGTGRAPAAAAIATTTARRVPPDQAVQRLGGWCDREAARLGTLVAGYHGAAINWTAVAAVWPLQ